MAPVPTVSIILYLAQISSEQSNVELHKSLSSLHDVFLLQHPQYPVVVAYEEEDAHYLTGKLKKRLRLALHATEFECGQFTKGKRGTQICFVSINDFRKVPWPFSMYTGDYREDNPYYSRVGYRLMCRFWTHGVFRQPFMQNVTSYFRMDTDTFLVEMKRDPFQELERERLGYLTSVVYKDSPRQVEGLWDTFLRFALRENIHPRGLVPLSNQWTDSHSEDTISRMPVSEAVAVLYVRGYNLDYIYNNWEVTLVELWKSPVYRRLASFIDKSGGIIMRRWGDAPIRTLALHLLREEFALVANVTGEVFRQYHSLTIYHKAYHRT